MESLKLNKASCLVASIFAVFVGLHLFHHLSIVNDPFVNYRFGDELYYHAWGKAISQGDFSTESAFFTSPLFAYVLGLLYWVSGESIKAVLILNLSLGLGSLVLVYHSAQLLFDRRAAVASLLLFGSCSMPIFYESFAEKTSLVIFLTALSFYLVAMALENKKLYWWGLAGAVIGLAALAHPLLLLLLPAVWLHVLFNYSRKEALRVLSVLTLTASLVISPATLHNYLQEKAFIPINSNAGISFYIFNHEGNTTGLYTSLPFARASIDSEEKDYRLEAEKRLGRPMTSSEVSSYWFRQGLKEVVANPGLSLLRFARKLNWSIGNEEITDTRNLTFYKERFLLFKLPLWGFGLLASFGIVGFMVSLRQPRLHFCHWFILALIASLTAFSPFGRYRLPLTVPFAVLGGVCLSSLSAAVKSKRYLSLSLLISALILATFLTHRTVLPGLPKGFFTDYYNLGNKYLNEGKVETALLEYEKALWINPANHPAVDMLTMNLADMYLSLGRKDDAEKLLMKAISTYPERTLYRNKLFLVRSQKSLGQRTQDEGR